MKLESYLPAERNELAAHGEVEELRKKVISLETNILTHNLNEDIIRAKLKLQSGLYLNKMKHIINQGKEKGNWELMAGKLFLNDNGKPFIGKTARTERMKVARFIDANEYINHGWQFLLYVSKVNNERHNKIKTFLKSIGISNINPEDILSKTYEEKIKVEEINSKLKKENIKISKDVIESAVQREIVFDKKLIKKLKEKKRPDLSLIALTTYNTTEIPNLQTNPDSKYYDIELQMEKLTRALAEVEAKKANVNNIPGYIFEDLAHYLGKVFNANKEDKK